MPPQPQRTTEPDPETRSPDARPQAAAADLGRLTTPASVLALQRSAGNAAVGRALRPRKLARQPTKSKPKAKPPKPKTPKAVRPRGASKDQLAKELDKNLKTAPANYATSGNWVHLVIDGGRIHVYDSNFLLVDSHRLKGVRMPQDGFYLSAFKGPMSKTPWFSARLTDDLPNGMSGWAPIEFVADADQNESLWIQDWVADDEKDSLLSALALAAPPNGPDRLGLVISRHSDRAKQIARLAAAISKEKGKGEGEGKGTDVKAPPRPPDDVKLVEGRHGPEIDVTVDGAHERIPFPDGASDEQLKEAIKRATDKVANEIDPKTSVRVHGGAKKTQIKGATGTSEVPLPEGFNPKPGGLGANTPAYPAKMISHGPGGDSGRESSVLGADVSFTMELDYGAMSFGLADETLNRAQNVGYHWELLDVSNIDPAKLKAKLDEARGKGRPDPTADMKEVNERFAQQGKETDSGISGTLKRDLSNTWEDTKADLESIQRDPWTYPYLSVVAISDIVQIGGALIGAFFSMLSQPLNERKIEFNDEGLFILRCFAWPIVEEDYAKEAHEEGRKLVIRAPSAAMVLVDVAQINKRASLSLDAREASIADLRKKLADATDETVRASLQPQLDAALISIGDAEAVGRQTAAINTELDRLRRWKELTDSGTPLEDRPVELRIWHATLEASGIDFAAYEERMTKAKSLLAETNERYTEFKLSDTRKNPVHPLMNFVSEETGEVYPLIANLVELKEPKSRDGRRVWRLIDITSKQKQDSYEGEGKTHQQAIRNAFVNFRENTEYGRGSLAIHLPSDQLEAMTGEAIAVDPVMHVRPGDRARALRRLSDLATAAEIASVFVSGPAAATLRTIGAVAGGITAAENIRRRLDADRFSWTDPQSYFDILGVVGAVVAVAGPLARGRAVRTAATAAKARQLGITEDALEAMAARAAWVDNSLHIVAQGLDRTQWVVIAASTYVELAQIEEEEQAEIASGRTPSPGKFRARRLEAIARGVKSGMIQLAGANEGGEEPQSHATPHESAPHPVDAPGPVHGEPPPAPVHGEPAPPTHGPPPHTPEGGGPGGVHAPPRPPSTEQTFYPPESPVALANTTALVEALASGTAENRVRLVSDSLIDAFWARAQTTPRPEGTVALRDAATGHIYVSKEAFLGSRELQLATHQGFVASMDAGGRAAVSEQLAHAFAERQIQDLVPGVADSQAVTPEARGLFRQLDHLAGRRALTEALFHNNTALLERLLGATMDGPRVRALMAALRGGRDLRIATRLAAEPNPALSQQFSERLYRAFGDALTRQLGGEPRDAAAAGIAQHLTDVVGQQVMERAYFDGDVESFERVLRQEVDDIGIDRLRAALNAPAPDLAAATRILGQSSIRNRGRSVDEIIERVQRELDASPDDLTYLPPDWARVQDLLNRSSVREEQRISEHLSTYMRGLQNPKLIVEILREAATRAWAADRSINWGLREIARENGAARGVPTEAIPHGGGELFTNQDFFSWAFRRAYFIDLPLIGRGVNAHTAMAHLLQDLVADRAFQRAGQNMSGPEFRALLGQATTMTTPTEAMRGPLPTEMENARMTVGQLIWYLLNDNLANYLPRPEILGTITRDTGIH